MDFFRGLMSVAFLYTVAWGIYQFGYSMGAETEQSFTITAQNQLRNCHAVITRNK